MKIFFAGGESMTRILKENKAENVLSTFYYLRHKSDKKVEEILSSFPYCFLDSGAFSFREQMKDEGLTTREMEHELQQYLKEYYNFLKEYGHRFFVVAELDVGNMYEKTKNREKLLELGLDNLLPVIHRRDTRAYIEFLCKKYPYVALGSVPGFSTNELFRYVGSRLRIAAKYGTRIHGFAITDIEVMKKFPFFSCDSTTWLSGAKYGMSFWYDGHKLRSYDKFGKFHRMRWKRIVQEAGVNWDDFIGDKAEAVNQFSLKQWIKFEKSMNIPTNGTGLYKQKSEYFRYRPHSFEPYERGIYLPNYMEEDGSNGEQMERNDG